MLGNKVLFYWMGVSFCFGDWCVGVSLGGGIIGCDWLDWYDCFDGMCVSNVKGGWCGCEGGCRGGVFVWGKEGFVMNRGVVWLGDFEGVVVGFDL